MRNLELGMHTTNSHQPKGQNFMGEKLEGQNTQWYLAYKNRFLGNLDPRLLTTATEHWNGGHKSVRRRQGGYGKIDPSIKYLLEFYSNFINLCKIVLKNTYSIYLKCILMKHNSKQKIFNLLNALIRWLFT